MMLLSFCLCACEKPQVPSKENKLTYHDIEVANYEILLGESVNKRVVRIPLLFDFELPTEDISCEVVAAKDSFGNNVAGVAVGVKAVSFTTDANNKLLLANVDVELHLTETSAFADKCVKTIEFKVDGKDISCKVNIAIKDRAVFGFYRNINKLLIPSENLGTIIGQGDGAKERVGAESNERITVNKICYTDEAIISGFIFDKYEGENPTELSVVNNLTIGQAFDRNDVFSASWNIEDSLVSNQYYGREILVFYTIVDTDISYVDSYLNVFCYQDSLLNYVVERSKTST